MYKTKSEFNTAVNYLKVFLFNYEKNHKLNYIIKDKTTNNFNTFKKEVIKNGYITISKDGCNTSIYDSVHFNILGRFFSRYDTS